MKRITTESGSVYEYDDINRRMRRSGDGNPYLPIGSDEWYDATAEVLAVGAPIYWTLEDRALTDGHRLRTTPVVSIEEMPLPEGHALGANE